ncbi:class II D-tagatose-bisphosphate aldolase non-catalytic subunit [Shimia abyssi]|uniref:Tagatose-bisphosphate aldolase noncatalytic subunit n=1 Tax=Shimia abyssi TaxID=1662395 RepID=A0A2P8FDG6_9RHOB|nr:class II D-tagatose-bisphosphate aldolase, non-catalytic subunit [Shimia abyssi]PSL19766.1 tagatose-bisphosphate aldolase noncatalytic subunit [Shimia abyssi]
MTEMLKQVIARNRAGEAVAIPSVCSAHPDVLRASIRMADVLGRPLVVEATSNQVNQHGGYMGMRPEAFIAYVHAIADEVGADRAAVQFGGDHLGTQVWRAGDAAAAMQEARVLVRDYVAAGFDKIHLDCSEGCRGEAAQLDDTTTATRSADLARACLEVRDDLLFVVGTEVPPPGGARMDEDGHIPPTDAGAARATLAAHDAVFGDMASMIGGLVVQPGVEFSPTQVHALPMERDPGLADAIADRPGVCLEAHSTDYQDGAVFPRLAELGFAFQKVGPALTFAYREAMYALDGLRQDKGALERCMEDIMLRDPKYWQGHYHGAEESLYQQRHFGLADRIRYYWPQDAARAGVQALFDDLPEVISDDALSKAFAPEVLDRAEAGHGPLAQRLIEAQIQQALNPYFFGEMA